MSYTIEQYKINERCRLVGISRSSRRYQPVRQPDRALGNGYTGWRDSDIFD